MVSNSKEFPYNPEFVKKILQGDKEKKVKVELFTWGKLDYVDKVKQAFGL